MIQVQRYLCSVLNTDLSQDILLSPVDVTSAAQDGSEVTFSVSLARKKPLPGLLYFDQDEPTEARLFFRLRFYGGEILRLMISLNPRRFDDQSPMLAWDLSLQTHSPVLPSVELPSGPPAGERWLASDGSGAYFSVGPGAFAPQFSPDGAVELAFQGGDQFVANLLDALPVLCLLRADGTVSTGFALHIRPGEHFCGTGERFERPDLFGQQIDLLNIDAAGVNNSRAYKNIPFLLSSRGYGIFMHSTAKMRLDIGAHSTRSLQWLVEDDVLDVFFIGGGSPAQVLLNYCRLTGFPALPPTWSFGLWMSRSSYFSDAQVSEVARRLRAEGYPADVLHLDTGWFSKDWICDWKFSSQNFPEPEDFFRRMHDQGFKISLWQYPHIHPEIDLAKTAVEHKFVGRETGSSKRSWLGYTLDFTNPASVAWYKSLLGSLLEMGAAAIKADFGEEVDEGALYARMDGAKYHNLFALLYQQAVWEVTEQVYGKGNAVIWARSGWAGSQRYPVHWGGDAASTFDGLAGTICGGLHFGLSGFAFWSHDVGGIHGIPDFMHSRPADELYVRWTQVGVFSSHMRYHGGTPREPWEYPVVSDIIREWLRFRYALLPYILDQARQCCLNGLPMLRSLIIDWPDDPTVWSIADEYLFGDCFLVCPVLNTAGIRRVYLPEGKWVDFWSGEVLSGPLHLHEITSPLSRLPLFVRFGSKINFSEPVEHTGLLAQAKVIAISFDEQYLGFDASPLKEWVHLDPA